MLIIQFTIKKLLQIPSVRNKKVSLFLLFTLFLLSPTILDVSAQEQKSENTTNSTTFTTKMPPQIDFSGVLALLVIYYIPAQFIERILELLKITKPTKLNLSDHIFKRGLDKISNKINNLEAEIAFFQDIRKKVNAKKLKKFEDNYEPGFTGEDVSDWTKEIFSITPTINSKILKKKPSLDELYELDTKKIDNVISIKMVLLSKAYNEQAIRVWVFSLLMAIIPGIIFAYYQIGLLQIIGISTLDGQIIDAAIKLYS